MRLSMDEHAWNRGFEDGEQGKPLHSRPYPVGTTESWSWSSGYVEGKAARQSYATSRPIPRLLKKDALAAEPCAVPLRSKAQGSASVAPFSRGSEVGRVAA